MAPAQPLTAVAIDVRPLQACGDPAWNKEAYRVIHVEEGAARVGFESSTCDLRAGELLTAAPRECQAVEPGRLARGWRLAFTADALDPHPGRRPHMTPLAGDARWLTFIPVSGPRRPFTLTEREQLTLASYVGRLERETVEQAEWRVGAARALLNLVLVQVTRLALRDRDLSLDVDPSLVEIVAVIDSRLSEPLSLEQLAGEVARSLRQVSRIVHDGTGESLTQLIEHRRMEAALRRLRETSASVNGIARAVGYPDPGYFRRRFRRTFGQAPASWRKADRPHS